MLWPVCSLVIVTVTLETARPWESLTVPRISPVFIWACAAVAPMSNKTPVAKHPAKTLLFMISCLLLTSVSAVLEGVEDNGRFAVSNG
jgi:hypothetical protein